MDQPDSVAVQNSREPARRSDEPAPLSSRRVLLAHSNVGHMLDWHERRRQSALRLGYNIKFLSMSEYHPYTIFPYLEKKWRRRDPALMGLYDVLGRQIDDCDIFIHFNGALIHPEFLEQFRQVKIYHCADDPDASDVISKPVARHYDMCAVANPSCLQMYRDWGCEHVFFWPLGAYHFRDNWTDEAAAGAPVARDVPLIFIGSKLGVTGTSIFDRLSRNYRKRRFMPLCYGGGVKSVEQVERIVGLGVEKVAISSAAVEDPELVARMADVVGSQSVVVVLDVRRSAAGAYEICTHNGTRNTRRHPAEFAVHLESLGVGEIVVNSIDQDGVMKGYDTALVAALRKAVTEIGRASCRERA